MKDQHSLLLAIKLHNGQMRRGNTEPYVCHCIRVADSVNVFNNNPLLYQAAILHDAVEDTGVTLEELSKLHAIADYSITLIDLLTKREGESRDVYINRLIKSKNDDAILIKIMDSLDNATMRVEDFAWYRDTNRNMAKDFQRYINTARLLLENSNFKDEEKGYIDHRINVTEKHNKAMLIESGYNL